MRKWIGIFVIASCLASAPVEAGWSFKQTVTNGGARGAEAGNMVSRVQIEGGDARIDFEQVVDNPMFGAGSYMVLRSAAPKGMFMVNPAKQTYMLFDPAGLSKALAPSAGPMAGAGLTMTITDAKLEKILEEPGGTIQGHSTTHYRYRKSYIMTMGVMNMKMESAHNAVEDVWQTSEIRLGMEDFARIMKQMSGGQMFAEMGKLIALEEQKASGFPLKTVTVDHSVPQGSGMMAKMMGGKEQTTTTTIEISEIQEGSIPAATFAIPSSYTEVQMTQLGAQTP